MFSMKIFIFFLAFVVAVVSSQPVHGAHKRLREHSGIRPLNKRNASRRSCKSSAVASALSSSTAAAVTESVTTADLAATTTAKAAATHASSTKSSSASFSSSTSKSSSSSTSGLQALIAKLFPVSQATSWSSATDAENKITLSDGSLGVFKNDKSTPHNYVEAFGKSSIHAHYPAGSYIPSQEPAGGISFYATGPSDVDLTNAKEATFGYSVYFPDGYNFVKGGKLPGLYGGDSDDEAVSCSGGRRSDACFSARLMWRTDGKGELYTYLPPSDESQFSANNKQCSVPPFSECNPTYGASVGRGSYTFATGAWTTVSQRVRLNDVGQANGELELFVNGESVINVSGLILRARDQGKIRGVQMQSFFGGSDSSWATPKDQDVYFADLSVAITDKF